MWLSDTSIRRPVLATVMSCLLLLFGVIGLSRLSVREYPDIDPPIVSVSTVYTGANAEVIENTITEPLEEELVGIEGIKTLTSTSQEQLSSIVLEFELDRKIESAAQDVRDRVARVRGRLPDDIEEPLVIKQDSDADAIIWLALSGKDYSMLEIADFADRYIVDHLQTLPGVARVIIGGQREYAMRIWLDPLKMASRGITVLDVKQALQDENVELPTGRIEGRNREFTVRLQGDLENADEFNRMIIKQVEGIPVYLEDIGRAELGSKYDRSENRYNGEPAIGLGIVKQSKANTLDVAHRVKDKVKGFKGSLPPGLILEMAYDSSKFIDQSIHEVQETLYIAGFLVVFVIFLFLGNLRATLIPAIAIPVSLITTFGIMYILGFTINILTLLALTLAIGLVVDDTIVVLENIYRRIESGEKPFDAAVQGTREIAFAVVATTISLVAVFLPMAFLTGVTGRLFIEFSIAVAGSVLISGFVSLSLAPMLCSKWLKVQAQKEGRRSLLDGFRYFLEQLRERYVKSLTWAMCHKLVVFLSIMGIMVFSAGSFLKLDKEFIPIEDEGAVITFFSAPEGSSMAYTDRAIRQAEAIFSTIPEVKEYFAILALSRIAGTGQVNSGIMFTILHPRAERSRKQQEVVNAVRPILFGIPEAMVFATNPPSGPGGGGKDDVNLVIQGFNFQDIHSVIQRVMEKAKAIPGLVNVDTDLKLDKPQLNVSVNREKSSQLGVNVRDVAETLQILLGGQAISTFELNSKRYDVMVQLRKTSVSYQNSWVRCLFVERRMQ